LTYGRPAQNAYIIADMLPSARAGEENMAKIEIYTTMFCGYCARAKRLLESKGVAYTEISVDMDAEGRRIMVQRAGGRSTVPQIFIDDAHVGGSDELAALDRAGRLDPLLGRGG
jgi:glutaredoxin 3